MKSTNDLIINVEGVGDFRMRRRNMRLEMAIAAEFSRLTEGVETPAPHLSLLASWISTLKVLTVEAPEGWDILEMDPLDDDTYAKLAKVHRALREAETASRERAA